MYDVIILVSDFIIFLFRLNLKKYYCFSQFFFQYKIIMNCNIRIIMIVKMEGKLIIFVTLFLYTKSIFYRWYANHLYYMYYTNILPMFVHIEVLRMFHFFLCMRVHWMKNIYYQSSKLALVWCFAVVKTDRRTGGFDCPVGPTDR